MTITSPARRVGSILAGAVALLAACNSGLGDCPARSSIKPGAACSDDMLQCPYEIPVSGCDGGVASSCTCTNGTWTCPSDEAGAAVGCGVTDAEGEDAADSASEGGADGAGGK
jgi:hypothetical protein